MKPRAIRQTLAASLVAALALVAACTLPGRPELVSPAISGRIDATAFPGASLRLRVSNAGSDLFAKAEAQIEPNGAFRFAPLSLAVFGHEFGPRYRAFLVLVDKRYERIVWRAEYSRRAIGPAVVLNCDLERRVTLGQPCQLYAPTRHAWLVDAGRRDYRRLCASCHGIDGVGDGPAASALLQAPADLTRISARSGGSFRRDEIAEWIEGSRIPAAHGPREMPIWGERLAVELAHYHDPSPMVGARIDHLVSYIEALQVR